MTKESHNKGQKNASDGKYERPYGEIEKLCASRKREDEMIQENIDYDKGWRHTTDQNKSGGCFLTTACVERVGLPDDCHQLTVLRSFRDNHIATLPDGLSMLSEYYRLAPAIVQAISRSAERDAVLAGIFATVNDAVELIEIGSYPQALSRYQGMFSDLKQRYEVALHSSGSAQKRAASYD